MVDGAPDRNRRHRADVMTGQALVAGKWRGIAVLEKTDNRIKTPPGKGHQGPRVSCLADIDTLPAKHAPVGMVIQDGVVLDDRYLLEEGIHRFGLQAHLQEPGDPLELTSFIGRTESAIHLMD